MVVYAFRDAAGLDMITEVSKTGPLTFNQREIPRNASASFHDLAQSTFGRFTLLIHVRDCSHGECRPVIVATPEKILAILPIAARVDGIYFTGRTPEAVTALKALAFDQKYDISQRNVYQIKSAKVENLPQNEQSYCVGRFLKPYLDNSWFHHYELNHSRLDTIARKQ